MRVRHILIVFGVSILAVASFNTKAVGQGAWNMMYLPIDSLSASLIGKEIRIDFRQSDSDIYEQNTNVRKLLHGRDTVSLEMSGRSYWFIEQWKLYVDHGDLSDQTLESLGSNGQSMFHIKEMFLESIDDLTLTIGVYTYTREKAVSAPFNKKESIIIAKKGVKGFLLKMPKG